VFKFNVRNLRNTEILFALIAVLLISSLLTVCAFVMNSDGAILDSAIHVGNEKELRNAVNVANDSVVIALTADITLTDSALNIPAGKDITLVSDRNEGFWKLIGTDNQATISVDGKLTLDGIIITHADSVYGLGVAVNSGGNLILSDGEILGNKKLPSDGVHGVDGGGVGNGGSFVMTGGTITNCDDGGVRNYDGTFVMSGGVISNNAGGGVNLVHSTFVMSGGEISGNSDSGVSASYSNFTMSGGTISGNIADRAGGGVSALYSTFTMSGGKISKNTVLYVTESSSKEDAKNDAKIGAGVGGGVYINGGSFNRLGGTISGNTASNGDGNVHKHGVDVYYFGIKGSVFICLDVTFVVVVGVIVFLLRRKPKIHIRMNVVPKLNVRNPRSTMILFALLAVLLISSLLTVCVFMMNSDGTILDGVVHVRSEKGLRNAVNNAVEPTIIILDKDIKLANAFVISDNKNITLTSNNNNAKLFKLIGTNKHVPNKTQDSVTIIVDAGGVLRLDGVIVTHATGADGLGVLVEFGGILSLSDGEISGNTRGLFGGGGVGNFGVFEMTGGLITNNDGGGVGLYERYFGGGVYVAHSGYFVMSGGVISNNTDSGVDIGHGGSFVMSGGVIANNTAGYGGGVCAMYGSFEMCGDAVIANNTAGEGGGVFVNHASTSCGGSFSMSGNAVIVNNTAGNGGGVYNGGTFKMSGDAVIANNTASRNGGGVYVGLGFFELTGGKIYCNTALDGGGVCNNGNFTMSGGIIFGNTAVELYYGGGHGGGVYNSNVFPSSKPDDAGFVSGLFNMSKGSVISNNTAVYGGGIYNNDGIFNRAGGIVADNKAASKDNDVSSGSVVDPGAPTFPFTRW
jgi:major membrane immunogen (membrane-anchored lipoprotein)